MTSPSALEAATEELYALPPTQFVARRDELVSQARAAGDRDLAAAIKALRRPSVGAWYLNAAARSDLTSLRELLRLGRSLRDAQSGGDFAAVKELAAQRGPLVGRVVRDLTAHLAELGVVATNTGLDEVRTTLASALADPSVADELAKGRLERAHVYSGFGDLPLAPAPTQPQPKAKAKERARAASPEPETGAEDRAARQRAEAQRELEAAERELGEATDLRAAAEADRRDAAALVDSLTAQLADARNRLARARRGLSEATERERRLTQRVEAARRRQS